jgi:MEDS: MEthanogen/methylotroph, DcmR Sensory domain
VTVTAGTFARSGHIHAVRFYDNDAELYRLVGRFLADGFIEDQPGVVIATRDHAAGIVAELARLGFPRDEASGGGRLVLLDADETLARFMVDGTPDPWRFRHTLAPALELASGTQKGLRAYGEMVDVLYRAGQHAAASRLEVLWNALANTHSFSLLCGYRRANGYRPGAVSEICGHHTHVASANGDLAIAL